MVTGGFVVGALIAGVLAGAVSTDAATCAVAARTAASGIIVFVRMYETNPPSDRPAVPASQTIIEPARSREGGRRRP